MNLLLDTHALIWFITLDKNLPDKTKSIIEDADNRCWVSIASLWEIGIKHSLGKLNIEIRLDELFKIIEESGFEILTITPQHTLAVASLAFHHRDPFDRMLVSQAISDKLIIVTKDSILKQYAVETLW